jgi:hypothetical protein
MGSCINSTNNRLCMSQVKGIKVKKSLNTKQKQGEKELK